MWGDIGIQLEISRKKNTVKEKARNLLGYFLADLIENPVRIGNWKKNYPWGLKWKQYFFFNSTRNDFLIKSVQNQVWYKAACIDYWKQLDCIDTSIDRD